VQAALRGSSIKEMSDLLVISPHTVQTHLSKIYAKLNVRSRLELIAVFSVPAIDSFSAPHVDELVAECIGISAEGFLWYAVVGLQISTKTSRRANRK